MESSLGFPEFTYTGNYSLLDDGIAEDGKTQNWRIKLLTSGTLDFTKLGSGKDGLDVFLVGGGGGGQYGGGGGGYTTTAKNVSVKADTAYPIEIGAGGTGSYSGTRGGTSSAFGFTAGGGYSPHCGNNAGHGGNGGSGGGSWSANGGSDGSAGSVYNDSSHTRKGGTGQNRTTREFGESSGTLYSGGGGGGNGYNGAGRGGAGGGGAGANYPGANGQINTGGGGGGHNRNNDDFSYGGSGIVIIRNKR